MSTKTVVEVPAEVFTEMRDTQKMILSRLQDLRMIAPAEYLTAIEFMTRTKMSRWKFNELRDKNLIEVIQRGRTLYVPETEVKKFFEGSHENK